MMIDSEKLKKAILESKIAQNEELKEYEWELYGSYYSGYMSGLSMIEGVIAELEQEAKPHKCGECKWLSDRKTTIGKQCVNPDKHYKWESASYKYTCTRACKRFEEKENG